jgi:serine/threonine protein phosphatase PrpC
MLEHSNAIEQLKATYITYKWIRLSLCVGIVVAGFLLTRLSGGFPPWAWRFLIQVVPRLPDLWNQDGFAMLLPLIGLLLLSITLLIAWGGLVTMGIRIVFQWWQERRELQHFVKDVQMAQDMARTMQEEILHASDTLPLPVVSTSLRASLSQNKLPQGSPPHIRTTHTPTVMKQNSLHRELQQRSSHHIHTAPAPTEPPKPPVVAPRITSVLEKKPEPTPVIQIHRSTSPVPAGYTAFNDFANPVPSQLLVGTGLNTGIKRKGKPNEDSLLAFEKIRASETGTKPVGLFVVADGMGGHKNGQEASQLVTRILRERLLPALEQGPVDEIFSELLVEGIHHANLALYQRNREQHGDMGTTLTAALIFGYTAYVANVGDSRTYLYRDNPGLSQITRDHSTVAQLVEAGAITRDEVYTHPKRNVIYRSLGRQASEDIDSFTVPLKNGDILLLCSDGLWEMVRDQEIEMIIRASYPYPSQISTMLIQAALNRGGKDNISVVVVYVNGPLHLAVGYPQEVPHRH